MSRAPTPDAPLEFVPPGPGSWEFDASHQSRPVPPLLQGPVSRGATEGFRQAFAEVGALLDTLEARYVHGWNYMAPRPVGAPPSATGTPPKWVFKALLWLHPELRRRTRLAETAFADKVWIEAERRWVEEDGPRHRAALLALQVRDPAARSDAQLRSDLAEAVGLVQAVMIDHFRHCIPGALPLGDLLVQAEELGLTPTEVVTVVAGASVETVRPAQLLSQVAEALRPVAPELLDLDDPQEALTRIAAVPAVAPAWQAFVREYGHRPVGGEIEGPSLLELPGPTLAALRRVFHRGFQMPDGQRGRRAAQALALRLPEDRRGWWADAVEQARTAMTYREDSAALVAWAGGLTRRVALELGRRGVLAGTFADPEDALLLEIGELEAPPDPTELRARAQAFARAAAARPPTVLGPAGSPPPMEWLPPAAARLTRAVVAYTARFHAEADLPEQPAGALRGLPVSPGVVRGMAVVIQDIADIGRIPEGCVLVARTTTAALNPVLPAIAGLVTELGGLICHAAIVSRELGFPGVVGCAGATSHIPDGSLVEVNGDTGQITVLAQVAPESHARRRAVADAPDAVEPLPGLPAQAGCLVPLADATDARRYGGKAAGLARALAAGMPVPQAFALDTAFVQAVAAGDPGHLARLAQSLSTLTGPLAVRSSAPDEDGAAASFAGLHHTELGVSGLDEVAAAITTCWRSAHGPAARAYRARLGIDGPACMAVLVQPIVAATAAGVRFGCDPVSGEDTRIIEAAPGLGAVVVDGRVRPDRVRLRPDGTQLERVEGEKPVRLVLHDGELREEAVSAAPFTLLPALVAQVHALGEACDSHFGGAQDVEWATDGDRLWLLQCRPVTTQPGSRT